MLNLGFRAHDFGKFSDAVSLAVTVSTFRNNACIHFAPYKSLADTPKPLTRQWAEAILSDFDSKSVKIAILGCYINPIHPDCEKREQELKSFENGIEMAKFLGNPIVATETGSLNPLNIRHEENWSDKNLSQFLKIIERLLNKAEEEKATIALEAVADKNTIDCPERMLKVMETFKSPRLKVLFDAVNILPIHGVDDYNLWFDSAVSMLSQYICAMHIKDFIWAKSSKEFPYAKGSVKNGTIPAGEGIMPWETIFKIYRKYNLLDVPMTLENFNPSTLTKSIEFVEREFRNLSS